MANGIEEFKVAWIEGNTLKSQMLSTRPEARAFIRKRRLNQYLLMRLVQANGNHYAWRLLPDGLGSTLLWMHRWWWAVAIVILWLVWGKIKGK